MAAEMDWAALDEDADACLRVFEALSANSDAAGLARDMMKGLKETRMSRQCRRSDDRKSLNADSFASRGLA